MAKCNASQPQLILFVNVKYRGRRAETNMVIVNIKLLSGYILEKSSLDLVSGSQQACCRSNHVFGCADGCVCVCVCS